MKTVNEAKDDHFGPRLTASGRTDSGLMTTTSLIQSILHINPAGFMHLGLQAKVAWRMSSGMHARVRLSDTISEKYPQKPSSAKHQCLRSRTIAVDVVRDRVNGIPFWISEQS
jgi:hypothetical protein